MTRPDDQASAIEYEPRLVEEAVLHVVAGSPEEARFRVERDRLYAIEDPEARERGFRALHAVWFERLGLGEGVADALSEQPAVPASAGRVLVAWAPSARDEGAELFVAPGNGSGEGARRTLVLRLRPETFARPARLRALLGRELFHVADMLDPAFGYDPRCAQPGGAFLDHLFRERYRVLWDAFVDGRLVRLGRAPEAVRGERFREFAQAFGMLGARIEEAFGRFFGATRLSHAELVAFAGDPEGALGRPRDGGHPGERCALCGFPSHAFEPEPDGFTAAVRRRIHESFPGWKPADGICRLCADLYRSRASLADEGAGHGTSSRRRA